LIQNVVYRLQQPNRFNASIQ